MNNTFRLMIFRRNKSAMFRKYLAAILLIPASFAVHGSPRAWLKALGAGRYAFFSHVLKAGAAKIRRSGSLPHRLFIYYPMKAGMEVLHGGVKSALRKIWLTIKGQRPGNDFHQPACPNVGRDPAFIPPERIKEMIRNPAVRLVSFDVFDTLLLRPALRPRDIFHLLAKKVDAAYGVDFVKMRWDAEARLDKPNPGIREIYAHMAKRHGLDPRTATALLKEEIQCEKTLLSPRPDVKTLYDEAARLGKRIIVVSDMYLPETVIKDILKAKGFLVDAAYVSCDRNARKSDGTLYETVLAAEGAHPSEILHVGDNRQSDYVEAIKKRITAIWLPSIFERCFPDERACEELFGEAVRRDPLWSVFLGFSLNGLYGEWAKAPADITKLRDLRHFARLAPAPLLTAFCIYLATDEEIRTSYKNIYFASRDGWLPHKIHTRVQKILGGLPGVYFAAGRRAYYPFLHDTFFEFAASLHGTGEPDAYTLHDFLKAYFTGTPLLSTMENALNAEEKSLLFFRDRPRCLRILQRFDREIADHINSCRERAKTYYARVFSPSEPRHLIFDLGYSGSIGKALSAATGKPADKLYFWEEPENGKLDKELGSTTRLFMKDPTYKPYHLLLEELFSPCEGGVSGFDENGQPVIEKTSLTKAHKKDLASAHAACIEYAVKFCALLGEYAPYATLREPGAATAVCRTLLRDAPFCNLGLFKNIAFPDPVYRRRTTSLEKKLETHIDRRTVFSGTGFENPDNVFARSFRPRGSHRIGMHLHLYHEPLAHEIIRYLQDFPAPFDLYVTITDALFTRTALNLFNRTFIPNAETVRVQEVPNRGRDVAPWILGMRPHQGSYDLFCHLHGKESKHMGFGDEWRKYLFDNLIRSDTVSEILNIFEENKDIGCIFPAIHPKVRLVMTHVGAPLYGSEHEYDLIRDMLERMGLDGELRLSELFFSVGTMLWYRPRALRQLFTFDLRLEEFPEEPIGVGGTLAHAMERLPAVVAARNGYAARSLTRHAAM